LVLYLVRHAKAYSRSSWVEADELRPLTPAGILQARAIATALEAESPARLISSPATRCYQTLDPLARALRLRIELDPRLAEGADFDELLAMVRGLRGERAVICGHGDRLPLLVERLAGETLPRGPVACQKGSFWRIEFRNGDPPRATYWLPRPASDAPQAVFGGRETRRLAVLDLGSSSFHLLVADAEPGGALHRVGRERVMLRLGATLVESGRIPPDARARAVETVRQMRWDAEQAGAQAILPVATAALREASNSRDVIDELGRALGTPVRLLTGREEAHLIFRALRQRLDLGDAPVLGLDLGGGSLEIAIGTRAGVDWETTLSVGTVRLHHELAPADPMKPGESDAIRERVAAELRDVLDEVRTRAPRRAIAIGGTMRAIFRLLRTREPGPAVRIPIEGEVESRELDRLAQELGALSSRQRLALPGISARRVDLLPTGSVIVATLAELLGVERLTVCDWGLREGVILEAVQAADPATR
jgi:exopolyphosphatase/guanosine-5'-triphosphate,3'-diphosphate pyrophosphatase